MEGGFNISIAKGTHPIDLDVSFDEVTMNNRKGVGRAPLQALNKNSLILERISSSMEKWEMEKEGGEGFTARP